MYETPINPENDKEQRKKDYIALAETLSKNLEGFPFTDIEADWYSQMKTCDEDYPGFKTPTDEIIKRMSEEGFKVVFGKDPTNGNVYLLPLNSNDIENDMIFPGYLTIAEDMDETLKSLILTHKKILSEK